MEPDVRSTLERLNENLNDLELNNLDWQGRLEDAKLSVREALDQPDADHPTLVERLEQMVLNLDEDHPVLATVIRDAITVLTQAGV